MKKKQNIRSSTPGLAAALAETGRDFHARGWALGTSGNFSVVLRRDPLRLLITASGLDKSSLRPAHFLQIDAEGRVLGGRGKPSAEAFLHVAVACARRPGAILHTHSVWSTLLSQLHADRGGLALSGYEMLKGLEGVKTHEHREWLPILDNSQDIPALASEGDDLAQARRHIEILEFLLEVAGRNRSEAPRL